LQNETNVKSLNAYMDHILHALLLVDSPIVEKVTGELSMQKLRAIYFLGKNSNSIQRELADYLGVSVSNTSVMVDALVKKQLVVRHRSDEDRRVVRISLTKEGQVIYRLMLDHHLRLCEQILQPLTLEEQETLLRIFDKAMRLHG
jgi:DNA-binding MarR family transcriptional regulator